MCSLTDYHSFCKKIIVELEKLEHWEAWPKLFLKFESVLVSDIAVYKKGSLEIDFFEHKTICEHMPKLIIEVISNHQSEAELKLKTQKMLDAGIPAVWIFDPYKKIVFVFTKHRGEIEASGIIYPLDLKMQFNNNYYFININQLYFS